MLFSWNFHVYSKVCKKRVKCLSELKNLSLISHLDFKCYSTLTKYTHVHKNVSNVTGSRLLSYWEKTRGWGRCVVYKSSGEKIGNPSRGHGVLPFCMGRMWFKLAVTSSNWFLPVVAHDKWTVWRGLSRHFRFRTLTMQMCYWIVDLTYSTL